MPTLLKKNSSHRTFSYVFTEIRFTVLILHRTFFLVPGVTDCISHMNRGNAILETAETPLHE